MRNEQDPLRRVDESSDAVRFDRSQRVGFVVGVLAFIVLLLAPAPAGLELAGWRTVAVAALMATWWMTDAVPIPATALLPLVLFPMLNIAPITEAAAPFANPLIYLYAGGFTIAIGMQRWGLHRRIALGIVSRIGTQPRHIILGFMLASAFMSMWVSNTATTMMMLPIAMSVVTLARMNARTSRRSDTGGKPATLDEPAAAGSAQGAIVFSTVLMLGIAYGATVGGLGTLIGTPPNALLAGFLRENYNFDIGFFQWMLVGIPLVAVGLPVTYFILTRLVFPIRLKTLPGGRELIDSEIAELGRMTYPEKLVAVVFVAVVVLWITRPLLTPYVPGLSDTSIAILGALLLFVLPVDLKRGRFVLTWREAEELPWGVLILFGGGLSLASAINGTGLAAWIGSGLSAIGGWPVIGIIIVVTLVVILLTELTSNLATAAVFTPILASVAIGIGENPLLLVVPAALAASGAFMLPVATPPNAIVYGSGVVDQRDMLRAGLPLNLAFAILFTAVAYTLVMWTFGVEPGTIPVWVG